MFGDFDNSNPTAVDQLESELRQLGQFNKATPNNSGHGEAVSTTPQSNQGRESTSSSGTKTISPSTLENFVSSGHIQSKDNQNIPLNSSSRQSTLVASQPFAPIETGRSYFQLCVNTREHTISLGEIDVTNVETDGQLFEKIWKTYSDMRGHGIRRYFMKPSDIHFVQVGSTTVRA
jgi:hypothetical protein